MSRDRSRLFAGVDSAAVVADVSCDCADHHHHLDQIRFDHPHFLLIEAD